MPLFRYYGYDFRYALIRRFSIIFFATTPDAAAEERYAAADAAFFAAADATAMSMLDTPFIDC